MKNQQEPPGYELIKSKIEEIDNNIKIERTVYDSMVYHFYILNEDRQCEILFSHEFLDDLNDYRGSTKSQYWIRLEKKLTYKLEGSIQRYGLVPFSQRTLKNMIIEHLKKEKERGVEHLNKFNMIGRPYQSGSLEQFIGVKFTDLERVNAGSAFDELKDQRLIIPTYKDLVNPEDWVAINESIAQKSVSETFLENTMDWNLEHNQKIEVSFTAEAYEIFQVGLKKLYEFLRRQKISLNHLKLESFPYEDDISWIKDMIEFREKELNEKGAVNFRDRISLSSREYLKAAGIVEIIDLEQEKLYGKYPDAIKKEINRKIEKIQNLLESPVFKNVKPLEFIHDYKNKTETDQQTETLMGSAKTENGEPYDVVLSFAGEDRGQARKLAVHLKNDGFKVFFDEFEEAKLWGKNLYDYLSEIYSRRGRYCVMFLSEHYARKQWTNHERRSAQERAFKEHREYILPIRIDDTEIPGMLDTISYLDLSDKSIKDIYDILKKKLINPD